MSLQISRARILRKNLTQAEKYLWYILRGRQINNLKFRRQAVIGKYIVDFVCYQKNIIIEVDGGPHFESKYDSVRDSWLSSQGYKVFRFWNNEVLENREGVLEKLIKYCS